MKNKLFVMFATFFLCSCNLRFGDFVYESIMVKNNSSDTIAFFDDTRVYNPEFPSMFDELPDSNIHYVPIKPNGFWIDDIFMADYFDLFPDKKAKFYFFSMDTLRKYTWKEIKESHNYLRRYDLSKEDLDSLNWIVTYP